MVAEGQIATIHFVGRVADGPHEGEIFDTTDAKIAREEGVFDPDFDYEPLSFRVGSGDVMPGIEDAVRDMGIGDKTTVTLDPEEAFGSRDRARILEVPRDTFEADPDDGGLVKSETGDIGWITRSEGDLVEVDFNHELAGQPVEVELWVVNAFDSETA